MNLPSTTLLALMRYAKSSSDYSLAGVTGALAPVFYPDLSLTDVVSITHKAYEEALGEPRFEIGSASHRMGELLTAPVKGPDALNWPHGVSLTTTATVEQFYSAILSCLMGHLRLARVDWLAAAGEHFGSTTPNAR